MASVHKHLLQRLAALEVQAPKSITLEQAREIIAEKALAKNVLDAFCAGIRPTLSDWLEMPDKEKVLWQQYYEEEKQGERAALAAIFAAPLSGVLQSTGGEREQRMAALDLGLSAAGI